jgi:hypothetical protein
MGHPEQALDGDVPHGRRMGGDPLDEFDPAKTAGSDARSILREPLLASGSESPMQFDEARKRACRDVVLVGDACRARGAEQPPVKCSEIEREPRCARPRKIVDERFEAFEPCFDFLDVVERHGIATDGERCESAR